MPARPMLPISPPLTGSALDEDFVDTDYFGTGQAQGRYAYSTETYDGGMDQFLSSPFQGEGATKVSRPFLGMTFNL